MAEPAKSPGSRAQATATAGDAVAAMTARRFLASFYLRFHIALILLWSFSAGLLTTKALLWTGVESMLWRYPLTLLVSYGAFFLGVRIWLAYVGADPFGFGRRTASSVMEGGGNGSGFDLGSWRRSGTGTPIRGGGGGFGGGGASGSFTADTGSIAAASDGGANPTPATSWFSGGAGGNAAGKGGGGGIDLDLGDGDGWLVILLLILVAALLSSALGAVIYLVHSAPTILAEVAFQAMLAGGMLKSSRRWREASWKTSLLKSTWIPFVIVFVLALGTAALAARLFPTAHTLPDVIRNAVGSLG